MCQPPCGGRNVDKGLSDGMECTVGEPSRFHGTVDGTLLVVFLDGTEIECKNEELLEKMPIGS